VRVEFTIAEEAKDYSMSSYGDIDKMGGFTFHVKGSSGEATVITTPKDGAAPQKICVPATWHWHQERINISTAYTGFSEWDANYSKSDWLNTVQTGKVLP